MICPRCGEDCHCDAVARPAISAQTHPRFQPEAASDVCLVEATIPETTSLDGLANEVVQQPRFVPICENTLDLPAGLDLASASVEPSSPAEFDMAPHSGDAGLAPAIDAGDQPDPDAWRREVAARLNQYRSRRKVKEPRYPSLRLNFDPPAQTWNAASLLDPPAASSRSSGSSTYGGRQSAALERIEPELEYEADPVLRIEEVAPLEEPEPTAKIIEFPRSYTAPVRRDELADPVIDRPRIVEAPDIVPPPPAMGGILITSPTEKNEPERRPGFDLPLQSAPLGRRILAAIVDLLIVSTGLAAFGFVAFQLVGTLQPTLKIIESAIGITALFWFVYQYAFLVHNGSSPGLRAARLQLRRFDGRPVSRNVRRWRVITSALSGLSLGMGYGWCFLDEDGLCWHDRITHTYLEPKPKKSKADRNANEPPS